MFDSRTELESIDAFHKAWIDFYMNLQITEELAPRIKDALNDIHSGIHRLKEEYGRTGIN